MTSHSRTDRRAIARAGVMVMAMVAGLLLAAGSAGAQEDPYDPGGLSILDPSVCVGEPVTADTRADPGQALAISFAGQSARVVTGADGSASANFSTDGMAPGEYTFTVSNGTDSASAPVFLTGGCGEDPGTDVRGVAASPGSPAAPPGPLQTSDTEVLGIAFTGTDVVAPLIAGGLGLLLIGFVLVRAGRRTTIAE